MLRTKTLLASAAACLSFALAAPNATAQGAQSPLVGFWSCTANTNNGMTYVSTYDYRADGTYLSTQHIAQGGSSIDGGGGGTWRYQNGTLSDTKQRATLDRFIRNGVEVPSSDPEWRELYRQSQTGIGATTTGPIRIEGDMAYAGNLTCRRRR